MDKRTNRVQPKRLQPGYFPLDIRKSIFINDKKITLPKYYVESWGDKLISKHDKDNSYWEVNIKYTCPRELGEKEHNFPGYLFLSFIKDRSKASSYRLGWDNEFAKQLANDYPQSFVRSLEFHIGDEYYKKRRFTEFDIGGFKEQLQVSISWNNNIPEVKIGELFKVRKESQLFPGIFKELSSYLITDYLLGSEEEVLRRIQTTKWKKRSEISKELNENNIYLLLNRGSKEIYIGETEKSMSNRYPHNEKHHTFDEWTEYTVIQLPPETSKQTRKLIERVLISVATKLFPNNLIKEKPVLDELSGLKFKNRKL